MYSGIAYNLYIDSGARVSIDSIRLKFVYKYQNYSWTKGFAVTSIDKLSAVIDSVFFIFQDCDIQWTYHDFFKIGSYCRTCRVSGNDWSFAVLFGRYVYDSLCRNVAPEIVLDLNPNKVPMDIIHRFVRILSDSALSSSLVRFDVAFDFPFSRDEVLLLRSADSRKSYRLFLDHGSKTEYQGPRASHGAMKLYDKSAEAGLPVPVTRCELTLDGSKLESLPDLFPRLYRFAGYQLDVSFSDLPFPVRACLKHPDLLDDMLQSVTYKTRVKYLSMLDSLQGCVLTVDDWSRVLSFLSSALSEYRRVML